jgi:dolichol-phosphate mannosyltransferase
MKFAILVPTYNEATSIVELLDSLSTLHEAGTYQFDVLVIDDNSPDQTAEVVRERGLPWVSILKRDKKDGLGNAYRAGGDQS